MDAPIYIKAYSSTASQNDTTELLNLLTREKFFYSNIEKEIRDLQ